MEFKILETNRGNKSIICDGYSYRFHTSLKNGELSWRCSNKKCKVIRMTTDAETSCIIHIKSVHNHEADDRKLERQELRINAKRKATEDPTARPSNIIRKELTSIDEFFLHHDDLKKTFLRLFIVNVGRNTQHCPSHGKTFKLLFQTVFCCSSYSHYLYL